MNITKLPSGSYRIRQYKNGKTYSVTVNHKPSKYEAEQLLESVTSNGKLSFSAACESYLDAKSNILSPSTISAYRGLMKSIDPSFMKTNLTEINHQMVQLEVNRFSKGHSAKYTHDFSGFIMTILKYYDISVRSPKLPQKEKKIEYIPTEEDVKRIYEEVRGSQFEIPIILASMGLRRGEICALTLEDLNENVLTINKALVKNDKNEWVINKTKTTDSTRTVIIPEYLADLIRKQGYVYNGFPGAIYNHLARVEKKLGIPHFSLHKMRHFFASYMHNLGYTDKQIQNFGGWKTDNVMKTVYQHEMEMDKAKASIASVYGGLIE